MQRKGSITEKNLRPLLEILVLKHVDTHNYLYDMQKFIHKEFGVRFSFSTFKTMLTKLEKKQHLLTSKVVPNPIPYLASRRVYTITDKGKQTLSGFMELIQKI